ncbi:MAG: hypothetical protein N3B21_18825 [Clostridia bacterium]|nr:hypothetical protein [Clostridia bacterium]
MIYQFRVLGQNDLRREFFYAKKLTKLQQKDYAWENALEDFLFFKQAQGLSNRTISDYKKPYVA